MVSLVVQGRNNDTTSVQRLEHRRRRKLAQHCLYSRAGDFNSSAHGVLQTRLDRLGSTRLVQCSRNFLGSTQHKWAVVKVSYEGWPITRLLFLWTNVPIGRGGTMLAWEREFDWLEWVGLFEAVYSICGIWY